MKFLLLLLCMIITTEAYSQDFKIRAREHFETHKIKTDKLKATYRGLGSTLNFWWEKPYDISYGVSFSSILSNLTADESDAYLGETIKYFNLGLELKYFMSAALKQVYIRPGIAISKLEADEGDDLNGHSGYLGIGYEYPFKHLGLALEAAYRFGKLSKDTEVTSFTPSIGFHFYKIL